MNDMREIPAEAIEVINGFNRSIRLDSKLSENRDPDFLLLLMNRYEPGEGLAWIVKLVEQYGHFESLPVQVLAEYAISTSIKDMNSNSISSTRYKSLHQKQPVKSTQIKDGSKLCPILKSRHHKS